MKDGNRCLAADTQGTLIADLKGSDIVEGNRSVQSPNTLKMPSLPATVIRMVHYLFAH